MDGLKAAGSVFMCRLCNLFSPSRSQLLAHCSQLHPQQEPPDDIIVALQPLVGEPVQTLAESPVKRKRGRPKGSTKKTRTDLTEEKADSTRSPEDTVQRKEDGNKEEGNRQCSLIEGESHDRILGLECRVCHRSFSNRRQILKHICLREEEEEEDGEENGRICGGAGAECSGTVDPGGADLNQMQQHSARTGVVREKDVGSLKPQRTNRSRISKEGGLATGNKKSVISVVLTEDKTLPGVSKMVPVEDSSAETESVAIQAPPQQSAVFQSQSKSLTSDVTTCEGNTKTDQEQSSDPTSSTTTTSRGFQEYSIKQNATSLLQSQLKIFACEFCNKIFKFRHSLVAHLRTHTQEKPFQCPHCDYASAIKANLNVHLRKHTGEKFSCQHCPFNCLSPGHLKVHIERVHLKVKQHCSFCEKKYSDVKNLLKHMEKQHNLKDPAVHQSYQQLRLKTRQGLRQLLYHCPTCNRRFKNHLERERHLLVHGPQRPFACHLCDHAATKMAALAAHVRKHLFLYVCCVCDGKFVSSQRLEGHLKESHTELDQEQVFTDCINNSYYLMQPEGGMWGDEEREGDRIEQEVEEERTREEGGKNDVGGEEHLERGTASKDREQGEEGEGAKSQGESAEELQVINRVTGKGLQEGSQEVLHEAISMETTTPSDRRDEATAEEKSQDGTDSHTPEAEGNTQTFVSPGINHAPLLDDRTQENTHPAPPKNSLTSSSSGNTDSCDLDGHTHLSSTPADDRQTPQSERSAFQQVFSSLQKTRLNMESFQRTQENLRRPGMSILW
ncbi:Zinc finger protein ZFAT [Collichthys lucidus]|uniref:Zinc finger protein ZFAT n=1 Tax=Collichthys lucidus TaxID=240159 RepID=A0A4U5V3S6_COLLU|nr:Zinc finger protein ZFAT [Collichthys lucidus]